MSDLNPAIFKAYDIRGVYPTELNEEAAYAIGRAFARRAAADHVVVGSDMRLSGPALKRALIQGITDEGVNVVDIGLVPIDAVYFAINMLKHPAGVMVTASHNPKEYNGFKMALHGAGWVTGEEMQRVVVSLASVPVSGLASLPRRTGQPGTVTVLDVMAPYLKHVLSFVDLAKIKPFTVVVDAGNGLAGKVIPLLQAHLPITVVPLNFELDGRFPAHPSNPLLAESQAQLTAAVVAHRADFGVIFDGDTDRLFFVDETGQFIRADLTLLILAKEFLRREPGAGIVYNAICSRVVPEKIAEWGGRPLRSKVGFVNISQTMRTHSGIMGGEVSAHYSFRDNGYADSGFIAWLILLQLLSEDGRPLSKIVGEFQKYFKSDEINLTVADRAAVIDRIRTSHREGKQDELDGLTVAYDNWWFNVRPSNTEPLLRLTVEANTPELLEEKKQELTTLIGKTMR